MHRTHSQTENSQILSTFSQTCHPNAAQTELPSCVSLFLYRSVSLWWSLLIDDADGTVAGTCASNQWPCNQFHLDAGCVCARKCLNCWCQDCVSVSASCACTVADMMCDTCWHVPPKQASDICHRCRRRRQRHRRQVHTYFYLTNAEASRRFSFSFWQDLYTEWHWDSSRSLALCWQLVSAIVNQSKRSPCTKRAVLLRYQSVRYLPWKWYTEALHRGNMLLLPYLLLLFKH